MCSLALHSLFRNANFDYVCSLTKHGFRVMRTKHVGCFCPECLGTAEQQLPLPIVTEQKLIDCECVLLSPLVAQKIHYPRCWDTSVYPTLSSALSAFDHDDLLCCSVCVSGRLLTEGQLICIEACERRAHRRSSGSVAAPVTPPLSLMGETFRSQTEQESVFLSSAPLSPMGGTF